MPSSSPRDLSRPIRELSADADDHTVAAALASAAGRRLLDIRTEIGFTDAAALKSAGDQGAQDLLADQLARLRPDDSVLSEEARDDPARLHASRVWIIDPLDGTREFSEAGRSDWAVHVALWIEGVVTVGAVALPARGITLCTPVVPAPPAYSGRPRVVVSRTRPPAVAQVVAVALDAEFVPLGSAGAKVSAVLLGEAEVYVHGGGQYEWDSAAPVAVAKAAGLHASRLDGSDLVYNQADPYLPDLVVCQQHLREAVLKALR